MIKIKRTTILLCLLVVVSLTHTTKAKVYEYSSTLILITKNYPRLDTIAVEDETITLSKTFEKEYFKCVLSAVDSVKFTVVNSTKGVAIASFRYEPKGNEIAFFYGVDKYSNQRQMYFIVGKDMGTALTTHEQIDKIKIVEFLEHGVYDVGSFSGMLAYDALTKAIVK